MAEEKRRLVAMLPRAIAERLEKLAAAGRRTKVATLIELIERAPLPPGRARKYG